MSMHCVYCGMLHPSAYHETSHSITAKRDGSGAGPPGFELKPDCVTLNNILKSWLHGCLTYKMTTVPTSQVAINIKQVNACLLFEKYLEYSRCPVAPLGAQWSRIHLPMQETQVWSLGWEDPVEKATATLSSIFAWKIPMDRGAW